MPTPHPFILPNEVRHLIFVFYLFLFFLSLIAGRVRRNGAGWGRRRGKKTSLSAAGIKANTFTFDIGVHFAVKRFYPI